MFLWNNFSKYFCCYSNCITVCGFSPTVLTCMSVPMSPTRQDCGGEGGGVEFNRQGPVSSTHHHHYHHHPLASLLPPDTATNLGRKAILNAVGRIKTGQIWKHTCKKNARISGQSFKPPHKALKTKK